MRGCFSGVSLTMSRVGGGYPEPGYPYHYESSNNLGGTAVGCIIPAPEEKEDDFYSEEMKLNNSLKKIKLAAAKKLLDNGTGEKPAYCITTLKQLIEAL